MRYIDTSLCMNNIFITHMNPDHISGLVPILFYKNVSNNLSDIIITGPGNIKTFIDFALKEQGVKLKYKCIFHDVENKKYLSILLPRVYVSQEFTFMTFMFFTN